MSLRRSLAAACCALLLAGCAEERSDAAEGRPDILFLVVDTLRADHLGSYEPDVDFTPCLDRFASTGIVFQDTIAQAPHTLGSSPAILGSIYVSEHGYSSYELAVADEHLLLPEVLSAGGYETFAVSANPHVTARNGLAQGFDSFLEDAVWTHSDAHALNEVFLDWLDEREAEAPPFFAMLWYVDPHEPYEAPRAWVEKHVAEEDRELISYATRRPFKRNPSTEAQRRVGGALYDAEVEYLDSQLCDLFDELGRRGLVENTLIVFTSDHGESFYEHDDLSGYPLSGHGASLYREELAVPLIFKLPGGEHAGEVVPDRVRSVDIAPTVLTLVDAWTDEARDRFHGVSLVDPTDGRITPPENPTTVSELYFIDHHGVLTKMAASVETAEGKLMLTGVYIDKRYRTPVLQLYEPLTDNPLPDDERLSQNLMSAFRTWRTDLSKIPPRRATRPDRPLELRQRLRDLGYIH